MLTTKDGSSLITAGLDHWFKRGTGEDGVDADEYIVQEWRLEERLRVDHFCMPPDFRNPRKGQKIKNALLTVPFLRFPQWHFCATCRGLDKIPIDRTGKRVYCLECFNKTKKKRWLAQVPFVAICEAGHIQDFPWREWVHRTADPSCDQRLRLKALGGASLASQQVSCDCGRVSPRSLAGITTAYPDGETELSKKLEQGSLYLCGGGKPWLALPQGTGCGQQLRGSLRGAGNVYYSQIVSSIYLPREDKGAPAKLLEFLSQPGPAAFIRLLEDAVTPQLLRKKFAAELNGYNENQVAAAIQTLSAEKDANTADDAESELGEADFRAREFEVLREPRTDDDLVIRATDAGAISPRIRKAIERVTLLERLRETRVFTGFSRIFPESSISLSKQKTALWREQPRGRKSWLPAYVVYGEGIFIELRESFVKEWECRESVQERTAPLVNRFNEARAKRRLRDRNLSARFVMLHTLSHLLMNRLTFECGYSTAALRERLYCDDNPKRPMAGILIYTADGDADGTMGGLVRMGRPGVLQSVVERALEAAMWCSADPVCMEAGGRGGQGPDSLNGASCHSCGLVPETACEEFNRFLDRALVVGDGNSADLAFFS